MQLLLEMVRSSQAADPFAFQIGPQQYVLRTALGGAETALLDWDDALLEDLWALRDSAPAGDRLARIGARLRQFLSTTSFGKSEAAILDAVRCGEPVFVTLRLAAAELFALPWELLTLSDSGVQLGALDGVLLRYAWPQTQTSVVADANPKAAGGRIVFAWSAAGGAVPAAEQSRAIADACKRGLGTFDLERDVIPHLTPKRLAAALDADAQPVAVLHLLCHGAERDGSFGLCLDDEDGGELFADATLLRQLLLPYAASLRLVVLSSCDSGNSGTLGGHLGSIAQALHRAGIAAVVASRYPLSVAGSLRLTEALYSSLLCDLTSLETALVASRQRLLHETTRLDWAAIQLYARPEDGDDHRPIVFRPYLGLAAFRMGHSRFLFGRDEERAAARQKLLSLARRGSPRFLVVSGASGTGKSSVVLGGLLPDLATPEVGSRPADSLRRATEELPRLLAALQEQPQTLGLRDALGKVAQELDKLSTGRTEAGWQWAVLRPGSSPLAALADVQRQPRQPGRPFLLVVDQLEELFTLCDDAAERSEFARRIWQLAHGESSVSVVVTLRVDFLGRCGELVLADGLTLDRVAYDEDHRVFVAQPSGQQLGQAITGPARLVGLQIAPTLVQRMLSDVVGEPGALPLLSYVLDVLWLRRVGRVLSEQVYSELGGVGGALGQSADQLMASLDAGDQRLARQLLVRLVNLASEAGGETRRRTKLSELRSSIADPQQHLPAIVSRFVDARLLVRDEDSGEPVIEFAHEALIRRWPLLRGFLLEDRQRLVELRELSHWVTQFRGYGTLLRGTQLGYAQRLADKYPDELSPEAQRLIGASVASVRRRRTLLALVASVVTLALSTLSIKARRSEQRAQAEKQQAETKTRTAQARLLGQHAEQGGLGEVGLLYAARAFQLQRESSTRSALLGALGRSERVARFLRLPSGRVHGLAFAPDSRRLVVATGESGLWRLDISTAAMEPLRPPVDASCPACPPKESYAVAFSPDGKHFASAGQGGQVLRWTARAGDGPTAVPFATAARALYSLDWSPDGTRLAAGAGDGQVFVLDASTGAPSTGALGGGTSQIVAALAFSPGNGGRLAVVGNSGQLSVFDTQTWQRALGPLLPQRGYLSSVAFSPSGQLVAAASEDGQVLLWDSHTGTSESLGTGRGHAGALSGVGFGPDGRWLVSCGLDGTVRLWDVHERRLAPEALTAPGPIYSCAFSPDGRLVASGGDGLVVLWDVALHPALHRSQLSLAISSLSAAPQGTFSAIGSPDGSLRLWPIQQPAPDPPLPVHSRAISAITVGLDEKLLATGSLDGSVAVFATRPLWRRRTFAQPGHGAVMAVALSTDGDTVGAGYADGTLALFGIESGRGKALLQSMQQSIGALAFASDGRLLWSGGLDGTIRSLDVATSSFLCPEAATSPAHKDAVMSLSALPQSDLLASGSRDGQVALWRVAARSGCLAATGAPLPKLATGVAQLAFGPGGKLLASGGEDATVRIWDVDSRRAVGVPFTSHRRPIRGLAFGSDGWLWSADAETVWRWDLGETRWVFTACRRAGHNLSLADWQLGLGDAPYCRVCAEYPSGPLAPKEAPTCQTWTP